VVVSQYLKNSNIVLIKIRKESKRRIFSGVRGVFTTRFGDNGRFTLGSLYATMVSYILRTAIRLSCLVVRCAF